MDLKTNAMLAVRTPAPEAQKVPHLTLHRRTVKLSRREVEVLICMSGGMTSEDVGLRLCIAPSTVNVHRKSIIRKLAVTNITAAVAYALRHQIIA